MSSPKIATFSAFVLRIVNLKKHNDNRKRTGRYDLGPLKHLAINNEVKKILDYFYMHFVGRLEINMNGNESGLNSLLNQGLGFSNEMSKLKLLNFSSFTLFVCRIPTLSEAVNVTILYYFSL